MKRFVLPLLAIVASVLAPLAHAAAEATRNTVLGLLRPLDAALFGHLARHGLVLGVDDPEKIVAELKRIGDDIKQQGEAALKEAKTAGDMSRESKAKVDELLMKHGELQGRLQSVEQALDRRGADDKPVEKKTAGQIVVESDEFKAFGGSSARKSARVEMSRKDILNAVGTVGNGASPSNSLVPADRVQGIVAPPLRAMTIRDLLMPGTTDSNSIEYTVETGFTNNAAPVTEGGTKPKSDITFNLKQAAVRTIAHYIKASRQILDDAAGLRSYIDGRLGYGLQFKEETQLLSGDGTGANILGLLPQATAFNPAFVPVGVTKIDRLRLAILQVMLAEYPATGFVLNPVDWTEIELTKDDQGRYIIGNPITGIAPRLWNLPVVATQAMPVGDFLTGAFAMAAQIFDRMEMSVMLSTENQDDFIKNMVTILAEERLALSVYRPEAFVTGDLNATL